MLGSYSKEVATVVDEQLLPQVALWSWVVFVLWATPRITSECDMGKVGRRHMTKQRHGRYSAQQLTLEQNADVREQIQVGLDAGETK